MLGPINNLTWPLGNARGVAGPLLYDSFTGTNGTALNAHTPDIDASGGGWTLFGSTPQISGGKMVGSASGDNTAYVDESTADVILIVTYVHQTNTLPLFLFRFVDSGHYHYLFWQSGTWTLQVNNGGGVTTLTAWADSLSAGVSYALQLTLQGATATLVRDGSTIGSYGSMSVGLSATKHGLDLAGSGSVPSGTFDDFYIFAA